LLTLPADLPDTAVPGIVRDTSRRKKDTVFVITEQKDFPAIDFSIQMQ
jgi:hypothetical protein